MSEAIATCLRCGTGLVPGGLVTLGERTYAACPVCGPCKYEQFKRTADPTEPAAYRAADPAKPGSEQTVIELRWNRPGGAIEQMDSALTVLVAQMAGIHPDRLQEIPVAPGGEVVARWKVKPEPEEVVNTLQVKA